VRLKAWNIARAYEERADESSAPARLADLGWLLVKWLRKVSGHTTASKAHLEQATQALDTMGGGYF
jgi:hypothetical protein